MHFFLSSIIVPRRNYEFYSVIPVSVNSSDDTYVRLKYNFTVVNPVRIILSTDVSAENANCRQKKTGTRRALN